MPGILLVVGVVAPADPAPAPAPRLDGWRAAPVQAAAAASAADTTVAALIELCRRVSVAGSRAPGRRLHDELRTWLPTVSDLPSFALVAATEEGLAVALVGRGVAEVPDLGLRLTPADGERLEDGTPFLDQLVDWPPAALRLWAGSTVDKAPHALADLEAGAVPGAAAFLAPASSPAPPPMPDARSTTTIVRLPPPEPLSPLPEATSPPVTAGAPLPAPPPRKTADRGRAAPGHHHAGQEHAGQEHAGHEHAQPGAVAGAVNGVDDATLVVPALPAVQSPAPVRSASLLIPPDEAARDPLPLVSTAQPPAAPAEESADTRPKVKGFLCSRGHLNDPRVLFCNLCGIRMAERTGVPVRGVRPPLGLLLFDNGATVNLDVDYLLGREPETDERVRSGQLRPLPVVDQTGGISRRHCEIRLEGWDVLLVDIGSANGTLVAQAGASAWSSLVPHQPVRLTRGMTVRMGGRQFAFESPHGGS